MNNKTVTQMTAIELRTSINNDLSVLSIDALESISKYVNRLAARVRNHKTTDSTAKREVKISKRISQLSGRFSVPANMDYKDEKAEMLAERFE